MFACLKQRWSRDTPELRCIHSCNSITMLLYDNRHNLQTIIV